MNKIMENIFLYEGHQVKVCLKDNTEIKDVVESYDEMGITLQKSQRTISFDEVEDIFYMGKVTAFDISTNIGNIDYIYKFEKFDFMYLPEQEYTVNCHLDIYEKGETAVGFESQALEIKAIDVIINKLSKNLLDTEFLKSNECLYFFKDGKKVVGTVAKEKEGYKLFYKKEEIEGIEPEKICKVYRAPQKNDYIKVHTKQGEIAGLVVYVSALSCTLLTEEYKQERIVYDDVEKISYSGEIRVTRSGGRENRKCVAKLYGNEEVFDISAECGEENYKNGTIVTFVAEVDDMKRPQRFDAKILRSLSTSETEKPVEERVPVVVRDYEERKIEGDRFVVILLSDYENDLIDKNAEIMVYADEKNVQSNCLKKLYENEKSKFYDYSAQIDIYENNRYVFSEEPTVDNTKTYDKKHLANLFTYNRDQGFGFVKYKKNDHYFNSGNLAKNNAIKWNGGYKNFAQYINSLQYDYQNGKEIYRYHVVYTLEKLQDNPKPHHKFKDRVKSIHFVGVEGVNNAYDDIKTIVPYEVMQNKLIEKYHGISEEKAKQYKFGFLNLLNINKDTVKLYSGSKPKYKRTSEELLSEDGVEILQENLVMEEELDLDYCRYLVAYLEDGQKSEDLSDRKCYVVEKYNFNYCEYAMNSIMAMKLVKNGIEIITRKKYYVDMEQRMKEFSDIMAPFRDEITDKAPELLPYENVLVRTENGYELQEGKEVEGLYENVYRFGILTNIDPKQEYGYIDNRLQFAFGKLKVPTYNFYALSNRKDMFVCYCCDGNGYVTKVFNPTKNMISYIKWDSRNSMVRSVNNIDTKWKREYIAKVELWQGEHLNRVYANYYLSGDDDAVIKKAASEGKLEGKYVFVKTILGHSWVKEESLRTQRTLLPCYVVDINMQVEELSIVEEKGRFVARRNHNTFFPINGLVSEIVGYSQKRELQLKIDESGYGLEVNKNTEESSEEFLKKNPYEKAAQGEALDKDSKVYFEREEEKTVWRVISDADRNIEKSGNAVIIYGQKRCGKTSLIKKIKNEIEERNEKTDTRLKTIIIEFNNVKPILEISENSNAKESAEKLYREILRQLIHRKDAIIEMADEHQEVLKLSQKEKLEKYDWTFVFKNAMNTLKNPLIVIMDEFTDVCESVLAKYGENWKRLELARKEFDFISELKNCSIIPIIIGHENMHTALNELKLTNAISAKADPIEITCFGDPSAEGLIRIPMREAIGYYDPYGDSQGDGEKDLAGGKAVKYMMEMTGKNPAILMKLCDLMYKHYGDKRHYINYSMEKKVLDKENVENVVADWLKELTTDKADTLFDMILSEPADDWFFYDNDVYRFVFSGCKATESLAYVYLYGVAKRLLEYGVCVQNELYDDVFLSIQKKLEDKYNYAAKNSRRNKNALQDAIICRELSDTDRKQLIMDMCKTMEDKLAKRRIITVSNGNVDITMKLFVEYVKKHKM